MYKTCANKLSKVGVANLFSSSVNFSQVQFISSTQTKDQRWKKFSKFLLFLLKPSCTLKKKVIAGNHGAIRHRLPTSDIARYKLWNIFHLKYFPQLQCATTNRPMRHAWRMRRRLATPGLRSKFYQKSFT